MSLGSGCRAVNQSEVFRFDPQLRQGVLGQDTEFHITPKFICQYMCEGEMHSVFEEALD